MGRRCWCFGLAEWRSTKNLAASRYGALVTFVQAKIVVLDLGEGGLDSRGQYPDKTTWRHFGAGSEGAEYDNASIKEAALFDKVIETACLNT